MTGTENVNLTDTTGKYEMRVESLNWVLLLFHCGVCVCVCLLAVTCLHRAQLLLWCHQQGHMEGTAASVQHWLLPCPTPSAARPSVNSQRCAPVSLCLKKQTYSRENWNLFSSVCACAGERNNACTRQSTRSSADGTQVFWLEVFIYHGMRPPSEIISKHVKCICKIIIFMDQMACWYKEAGRRNKPSHHWLACPHHGIRFCFYLGLKITGFPPAVPVMSFSRGNHCAAYLRNYVCKVERHNDRWLRARLLGQTGGLIIKAM